MNELSKQRKELTIFSTLNACSLFVLVQKLHHLIVFLPSSIYLHTTANTTTTTTTNTSHLIIIPTIVNNNIHQIQQLNNLL